MTTKQHILDFYVHPAVMSSAGKYATLLDELPRDVGELVRIVQRLKIYEYTAPAFYGFTIPDKRLSESHIRSLEQRLSCLLTLDDAPLSVARPLDKRLVGICSHFALFLVSLLRNKGIPARVRSGFGSYFNPPYFEDHWVCEYWNAEEARWILVDAQFDEVWREKFQLDHDVLDVPRDRFLVAADAWKQCREGSADPSKFGIFKGDMRGFWFIAGSLVRDVAALNKMEMLPWDVWGAIPGSDITLDDELLAFFDHLAALTHIPDTSFEELRRLYEGDERLRVPATVFNAELNRWETI